MNLLSLSFFTFCSCPGMEGGRWAFAACLPSLARRGFPSSGFGPLWFSCTDMGHILLPVGVRVGVQVGGFTDLLRVIALISNKMSEGHFLHWESKVNFFK